MRNRSSVISLGLLLACGTTGTTNHPPDGGGSCPAGGPYGGGEASLAPGTVTASLIDTSGAPLAGLPALVCGIDLCSPPATSGSGGQVSVTFGQPEKKPAFRAGDAVNVPIFTVVLSAAGTSLGTLTLPRLPASGAALQAGATATSGDVTLAIPAGASVAFDQLTYPTAALQQLRTAALPVASAQPYLAAAPVTGFQLLYGVSPVGTLICPTAKLTVALPHAHSATNDLGWAPGAAVELWITSNDTGQFDAPYAGWAKASDGAVSADGQSVSTTDGQGVRVLQSFALRLKK